MPMRGELAPPTLRNGRRGEVAWQRISEANSLASDIILFSSAGLLLTVVAMLLFPASATQIALAMAQVC